MTSRYTKKRIAAYSVIGGLVLTCILAPAWAQAAAVSGWGMPTLAEQTQSEDARSDELENRRQVSFARMELNERVVNDLLSNKLSFTAGIEEKMLINRGHYDFWYYLRFEYPNVTSERELMARSTMAVVEAHIRSGASNADPKTLAKIRADYLAIIDRK